MCGIAGYMDLRGDGRIESEKLAAMTSMLTHRGPDAEGYHVESNIGLGFRRLRIVDLATGDQPLYNEDRSLALICNGEIFNEPDLGRELSRKGHVFRSRSDVEVILHLYEEHGEQLLGRLNGQFAFALYDVRRRRLLLARDPFGVNPLYFATVDGLLLFASEIKALLRDPAVPRRVALGGRQQRLSLRRPARLPARRAPRPRPGQHGPASASGGAAPDRPGWARSDPIPAWPGEPAHLVHGDRESEERLLSAGRGRLHDSPGVLGSRLPG